MDNRVEIDPTGFETSNLILSNMDCLINSRASMSVLYTTDKNRAEARRLPEGIFGHPYTFLDIKSLRCHLLGQTRDPLRLAGRTKIK